MSGFRLLLDGMVKTSPNRPILSRDIINQATKQIKKTLDHIILLTVANAPMKSRSVPVPEKSQHDDQAFNIEHRIKALVHEMGDQRALTNADDIMSRLEGAWHLQQASHHNLANQYDTIVNKLRNFARDSGFDHDIASADDVMMIITNLDQRWRQTHNKLTEVSGALDSNNARIKELAAFLGMEMPVIMPNVFDDVMDKWKEQHSKFIDLQKAVLDSQEESRQKTKTLQSIAKLMSVVGPQKQDALLDSIQGIWNGNQKKISDLQHEIFQQKEQIQRSQEQLQNLAQTLGVGPSSEGENILDAISGKWKEMKSLISLLRSSLLAERDRNANAKETLQGLADFMGVETSGDESTIAEGMMDKWMESRREVIELREALVEERKKTEMAEDALIDHLTRPGPDLASVATQTNDHQAESEGHLLHKAVQTDRDPVFLPKDEQEVQPVQVDVSSGISYRSNSFSFSASRDLVHCGPRCSSLKTLSTQDAFRPPSKTSLLQGTSAIASVLSRLDQPSKSGTLVSQMSDLVPWEESRCTIELGRGATGSVYLFRHAVSNIPVAAKVVEYAGECFRNEVRIHQAISGLPWFPRFYGSFDIDDDQAVLAMEFIGDDSEDRSYSLTDCLDRSMLKSGPDLTREEWFDVLNDVAKGLKSLHSKGFLSNDIKEDNVLVVEESGVWRAKIIDLGWASEISTPFVMDLDEDQIDFYQSGRGCGHIAPECVLDNRPCSTSSDIYSLGKLIASIGRKMRYDDFECIGNQICMADEEHRPTVQEIIDQFYAIQLMEGGEDDPGSSSC